MSVITFIRGPPSFSPSFDMATNFSTIGRTFPGLQYMMSLTRYMASSSPERSPLRTHLIYYSHPTVRQRPAASQPCRGHPAGAHVRASVFVGTSLDGFLARPNGQFDFLDAGGNEPHGYE